MPDRLSARRPALRPALLTAVLAGLVALAAPQTGHAAVVSADLRAEFGFEDLGLPDAVVLERLGAPAGPGVQLGLDDRIFNPFDFAGIATVGLDTGGLITLTGLPELALIDPDNPQLGEALFADYNRALFQLDNITVAGGAPIVGVTPVLTGLLDPDTEVGRIEPVISFTATSVQILFATGGDGPEFDFAFLDGGVSSFQLEFATPPGVIPLPATGWLLLGALGSLVLVRRRRG
ncbi:MAG: VPLPA-CTERM sorting domain-containing protein [Alkalilacustris sp.]